MRRAAAIGAALVLLVTLMVALAGPAQAHTWTDYYWWDDGGPGYSSYERWDTHRVEFHLDQSLLNAGSAFGDRAISAALAWNNQSSGFQFFYNADVVAGSVDRCDIGTASVVRFADTGLNEAAHTQICTDPMWQGDHWRSARFIITVNARPRYTDGSLSSWYSGTGQPARNQMDLWATLAHEFGHATGQAYHFNDPGKDASVCYPNVSQAASQSVCQGGPGDDTDARSLESHDVHTLVNAYANWPPPPPPTTTTTDAPSPPPPPGSGVGKPSCDTYTDMTVPPTTVPDLNSTNGFSPSGLPQLPEVVRRCV